jgi:hypothetical protein
MLSSRHTAQMEKTSRRQRKGKIKPLAVIDSNEHKAGVDLFDQILSYRAVEHKVVKCWRQLAFHCSVVAISNACLLHNTIETKELSTSKFVQRMCGNLVLAVDGMTVGDNSSSRFAHLLQKHSLHKVALSERNKKAQWRCISCSDKENIYRKTHLVSIPVEVLVYVSTLASKCFAR